MSIAPVFSGVSSFSSDLQQVITRAVSIASLPLNQLQNQLQTINAQASALSGLDNKFSALQKSIQDLNTALGSSSYSASSSDSSMVSASVSAGALSGSYTIDVTSVGSSSTSLSSASLPTVADPYSTSISSSTAYTLTVDGTPFQINSGSGGLLGLANAINSASAGVQASLVNTGNSSSPAYRLVIRSNNLGPVAIQLSDGSQGLLDPLNTGALASYEINGLPTAIQSNSRTVTLAPGVSVNLLRQTSSGQPVTIDVTRTTDGMGSAVSSFVDAYNATLAALDQQVGKDAGTLSGQSIVHSLYQSLSQITQYSTGSGAVSSLATLGVDLDSHGMLTFSATKFNSDSASDLQTFLGSTDAGGFLKAANDALNSVEDVTDGSVKSEIKLVNAQITNQNDLIAKQQQRIDDLQANLQQRMATADALLAQLENQRNYMSNLFTAMINSNLTGVTGVKSN